MAETRNQPKGMFGFTIIWIGQAVSLLGSNMTGFALTIWAYEMTQSATALAMVGLFYTLPLLIMSPFAGALVDRSNRKLMMMLSDIASGMVTIGILILNFNGDLQIWHLIVGNFISGTFQAFQWPAYSAAITMIVPKQHFARASAMMDLAGNVSGIFAPMLAGALLAVVKLTGILLFDVVSFVFAVVTLAFVAIPQPKATEEGQKSRGSFLKESFYGFRYILDRKSLLGLQLVFLVGNFFASVAFTLVAPMVLARTGSDEIIFGAMQTAGAIGGVVGGVAMSAWGGTKKKVHGVLGGWIISSLSGGFLIGLGRSLPLWAVGNFFAAFFVPLVNSSNQAIWQVKVAADVQGRVFAARRMIAWLVVPLANLVAGPLADFVMEPAMQPGGSLTGMFSWLVGTGPGAGMALIVIFASLAPVLVGITAYTIRTIRDAEEILPDIVIEETPASEEQAGAIS